VMTPAEFEAFLDNAMPDAQVDNAYSPNAARNTRWRARPKVAVIPVLGSIVGGSNQDVPLAGQLAGAQTFASNLAAAASDSTVKAIVIRVDSGGGDALASDLMYRAVLEAKKYKPVIASMGDAAASGGYYIAMGADAIFANAMTVTGSIGIFYVKPAFKNVLQAAGISQDTERRGPLAGVNDLVEPWSDGQRAAVQAWVNAGYDTFISEVAKSRRLSKAQVDAIAQGRVWSGETGKAKGLVDHIGSYSDAVRFAKQKAGLEESRAEVAFYFGGSGFGQLLGQAAIPEAWLSTKVAAPLPQLLQQLERSVGASTWWMAPEGLQARSAFDLKVQ
jgi:protease IV